MENSNFNQGGQRYDAIKHIDYLIDMVKDASSVPFSDKCSIERTETINSLQILKNNLPASVAQSNDIVARAQDIISTAREKNKKIIDDANRMYAMKVNDHEITRGAREEAAQMRLRQKNSEETLTSMLSPFLRMLTRHSQTTSQRSRQILLRSTPLLTRQSNIQSFNNRITWDISK